MSEVLVETERYTTGDPTLRCTSHQWALWNTDWHVVPIVRDHGTPALCSTLPGAEQEGSVAAADRTTELTWLDGEVFYPSGDAGDGVSCLSCLAELKRFAPRCFKPEPEPEHTYWTGLDYVFHRIGGCDRPTNIATTSVADPSTLMEGFTACSVCVSDALVGSWAYSVGAPVGSPGTRFHEIVGSGDKTRCGLTLLAIPDGIYSVSWDELFSDPKHVGNGKHPQCGDCIDARPSPKECPYCIAGDTSEHGAHALTVPCGADAANVAARGLARVAMESLWREVVTEVLRELTGDAATDTVVFRCLAAISAYRARKGAPL